MLLVRQTETWSPKRRQNGADQHLRHDLVIICDCVHGRQRYTSENYEGDLRATKITLIRDHADENFGVCTIDWTQTPRMRGTLLHEHVIKLSTA